MFSLTRFASVLLLAAILPNVTAAEPGDRANRLTTYESPQAAFDAYAAAVAMRDGVTAFEALTRESQNTLLLEHWSDELVGETVPTGLHQFVDEARRRKITRGAIPTSRRELPPLFARAIKDRRAAFQAILPHLWRLRLNTLSHYRLGEIKHDGNRATAALVFNDSGDDSNEDPLHFYRDDQGWLLDLRSKEYLLSKEDSPEFKVGIAEPKQGHYSTPAMAFEAYHEGRRTLNASQYRAASTNRHFNSFLLHGREWMLGENEDLIVLHWYGDLNAFAANDTGHAPPSEQDVRAEKFVQNLYDPLLFLAAVLKREHELEAVRGRRVLAQLREIELQGERAHGKLAHYFEVDLTEGDNNRNQKSLAFVTDCYFQKGPQGWQIDLPTADEQSERERRWNAAREVSQNVAASVRKHTYYSPEEVFRACQQARREFNVETVGECITPESWDSLIFNAWAQQYHFLEDPCTLHEVIDEKRRWQLTRGHLPVMHEDLQPLLIGSLTDRSGALALSLHHLDLEGELRNVKIEGNKAAAELHRFKPAKIRITHSLATHSEFSFVKDDHGWQISLVSVHGEPGADEREAEEELDKIEKQVNAQQPRQPKPWSGKPPPNYATPQESYQAQRAAFAENDPETAWHTLTADARRGFMQSRMLMLVEAGGGDYMIGWYFDRVRLEEKRGPHRRQWTAEAAKFPEREEDESPTSPANEARERWDYRKDRDWNRVMEESLHDPQAYFSALIKRSELWNRRIRIREGESPPKELKDVRIDGDRARAVVARDGYASTVEFARVNGSWLMDQESEEEHLQSWRESKEEARRSREKAEAEIQITPPQHDSKK